jgi:hypothetical protein
MGLILDSSILIAAERNHQTVAQLLKQVFALAGDQETALSAIVLVESTGEQQSRGAGNGIRQRFLDYFASQGHQIDVALC